MDNADEDVDDVLQEIHMLHQLRSDHIIRCFASFMAGTQMWIVMEYCAGGSCADLIRFVRGVGEEYIGYVLRETLKGLAYLHRERKMHRDIKAANILVTGQGQIKLGDFGVSSQLTQTLTHKKTFVGTPFWMAPEVVARGHEGECEEEGENEEEEEEKERKHRFLNRKREQKEKREKKARGYNLKADIWSLGVTAYELAEGEPPFSDMSPVRAMLCIMEQPAARLPRFQRGTGVPGYDSRNSAVVAMHEARGEGRSGYVAPHEYSDAFQEFVGLCLNKRAAKRPTCEELLGSKFIKASSKGPVNMMNLLKRKEELKQEYLRKKEARRRARHNREKRTELAPKGSMVVVEESTRRDRMEVDSENQNENHNGNENEPMNPIEVGRRIVERSLAKVRERARNEETCKNIERLMEYMRESEARAPGMLGAFVEEVSKQLVLVEKWKS